MVALRSPCTAFVFLVSDVVDVTVEEKRDVVNGLHCLRVPGQRRGWRRNTTGLVSGFPNFARERKWMAGSGMEVCLAERVPKLNTQQLLLQVFF